MFTYVRGEGTGVGGRLLNEYYSFQSCKCTTYSNIKITFSKLKKIASLLKFELYLWSHFCNWLKFFCQFKILLVNTWEVMFKYLAFWGDLGFSRSSRPCSGQP